MDFFHLPDPAVCDIKEFWPTQVSGATTGWVPWYKPRGRGMCAMTLISGGAGGGGGGNNLVNANKGGGGGGGSSGISRYIYPLIWLPDVLYILVGAPGTGGASAASGIAGQLSYVSIYPNITVQNLFGVSGAAGPAPGTFGNSASGGNGGSGGTAALLTSSPFVCYAISATFVVGVTGTGGGGPGLAGTDLTIGNVNMILPGTGGGGASTGDKAGGGFLAVANTPFIAVPGAAAGPNDGGAGFRHSAGPLIYGGNGGGSTNTTGTTGGVGGSCSQTAIGAGGGGGGGGITAGGRGGAGGPGYVQMMCF